MDRNENLSYDLINTINFSLDVSAVPLVIDDMPIATATAAATVVKAGKAGPHWVGFHYTVGVVLVLHRMTRPLVAVKMVSVSIIM